MKKQKTDGRCEVGTCIKVDEYVQVCRSVSCLDGDLSDATGTENKMLKIDKAICNKCKVKGGMVQPYRKQYNDRHAFRVNCSMEKDPNHFRTISIFNPCPVGCPHSKEHYNSTSVKYMEVKQQVFLEVCKKCQEKYSDRDMDGNYWTDHKEGLGYCGTPCNQGHGIISLYAPPPTDCFFRKAHLKLSELETKPEGR